MTVTNTFAAPTDKQIAYATALAAAKGYRFLSQAEKACFGKCRVGGMNREQVSRLIDWLRQR
jgi:hypothetical protein